MTAVVVILVLTGVVAGVVAALGAGLFALIVVPVGLALAAWLALAGGTGTRPQDLASREPPQELLGPGGQDDPTADR